MVLARRCAKSLRTILLTALGLTILMAAGAQAITWDESGKEITVDLLIGGGLKETAKLKIPGLNIEVRCTSVDVEKDSRLRAAFNDALAFLQYLGCTTHLISTGKEQPECTPTVLLMKAKIIPFLHNNVVKLLALPETGPAFGTIDFPGACIFTETGSVTGSVVFECEDGTLILRSCSFPAIKQLIKPVTHPVQLKLYSNDVLKFSGQVALLEGEGEVFLTEAGTGNPFNALI